MLINLMNANIGYFEIEKFKVNKYKAYCETMKNFCRLHSPAVSKVLGDETSPGIDKGVHRQRDPPDNVADQGGRPGRRLQGPVTAVGTVKC